ncbi:DNA damage-regulated autophagy modulator protein 2 isoform X2 [Leptinotarsa decemlineata]|uniref:DNA damage-regulated autophagy modulator protein 2 isoform X2 n=1 Tax=Leptinotarsa decemlineata TaxID=7539 RepID=UPI003D3087FF
MKISVEWLPSIICNLLLVLVVITVSLSFHYGHVTHIIPYISDTGTLPPESCIFGQVLNILWTLISFSMYIKFKQVQCIFLNHNIVDKNSLNKISLRIGLIAAFGVSIVANFQETNLFIVHWIGAVLVFGGGAIYICLQTIIYLKITPVIGQWRSTQLRVVLSVISTMSFVIFFVAAMVSYRQFQGRDHLKWQQKDGGFEWHNISTLSEWICATSVMIFILLFTAEFKSIQIYEPEVSIDDGTVNSIHPSGGMK